MSDLQDGHYVQVGPATELLRWRRMGRAASFGDPAPGIVQRRRAFEVCEDGAVPGLLPNWLDSCGTRLVDVPLFPPTFMRWK
jgi:hypothetical protein